jgi:UDP-N-acetylmuramate dehydrogenase
VLGGGSNVVIPDAGLDGLVLLLRISGVRFAPQADKTSVTAGAGEVWDTLVAAAVERDLTGIEALSGIPGLVGATPIQNVGAYGQEVAQTLVRVRAYDRACRRFVELEHKACAFGYRDSLFKSREPNRYIVTEVSFELSKGAEPSLRYAELRDHFAGRTPSLRAVRDAVLAIRRAKSMLIEKGDENARSCGSFFLNPIVEKQLASAAADRLKIDGMPEFPQPDGSVKLSAAWLIERSGLKKGTRSGNVGISSRHSLALVCHDGATTGELVAFAEHVRDVVREKTGITLSPEPVCL